MKVTILKEHEIRECVGMNQEAVDAVPQAFKISEDTQIPVMVCFDGFYLPT